MNTSSHISPAVSDVPRPTDLKRIVPGVASILVLVATAVAWHTIIGIALSSPR